MSLRFNAEISVKHCALRYNLMACTPHIVFALEQQWGPAEAIYITLTGGMCSEVCSNCCELFCCEKEWNQALGDLGVGY